MCVCVCVCVCCRLTSAVAEHRRSVRPSRRTQGSRNPLRALAAREDIRQDYMGERVTAASEERIQAENSERQYSFFIHFLSFYLILLSFLHYPTESKNSSESHLARSDSVISSSDAASYPPFSSLMLIHVKGQRRFGWCWRWRACVQVFILTRTCGDR